jgi:peptidoglycan-associated lipoprotein
MNVRIRRLTSLLALAAIPALFALGCAKKVVTTPPPPVTTPQTPPDTSTPVPPPPPPAPVTVPGGGVKSEDFLPALFDYDSYSLREDARAALDKNAALLRSNAGVNVTIEGHCDERGTAEYNLALGEKRAQAARDYLVAAGIDAGRLQTVSYGKERPVDAGHDEAAWARNRRAQLVVK